MIEIHSAQELVHSLVNAGDSLLVVDFYSPGCGGCKALHPKVCLFLLFGVGKVIFLKFSITNKILHFFFLVFSFFVTIFDLVSSCVTRSVK